MVPWTIALAAFIIGGLFGAFLALLMVAKSKFGKDDRP